MKKLILTLVVHPQSINPVLACLQCEFGATVQSVTLMPASRLLVVFSIEVKENDPDAGANALVCLESTFDEAELKEYLIAY